MRKSQGGKQHGKIFQQGYMVIITKIKATILRRTEEWDQKETFKTQRWKNM